MPNPRRSTPVVRSFQHEGERFAFAGEFGLGERFAFAGEFGLGERFAFAGEFGLAAELGFAAVAGRFGLGERFAFAGEFAGRFGLGERFTFAGEFGLAAELGCAASRAASRSAALSGGHRAFAGAPGPVAGFCDVEGGTWGVLVGGETPALVIGGLAGEHAGAMHPATYAVDSATGEWRLGTEIGDVQITGSAGDDGLVRCRATGTLTISGVEHTIDAEAVRCAAPPNGAAGSLRLVASWFASSHGVALLACRPSGASGHDHDSVLVAVHGESDGIAAFDPRLSTTYAADMSPLRMGIELWLGEHEDGDLYPRRVAGDRSGPGVTVRRDGVRIDACAMRCQSRGDEGFGVYLLVATP